MAENSIPSSSQASSTATSASASAAAASTNTPQGGQRKPRLPPTATPFTPSSAESIAKSGNSNRARTETGAGRGKGRGRGRGRGKGRGGKLEAAGGASAFDSTAESQSTSSGNTAKNNRGRGGKQETSAAASAFSSTAESQSSSSGNPVKNNRKGVKSHGRKTTHKEEGVQSIKMRKDKNLPRGNSRQNNSSEHKDQNGGKSPHDQKKLVPKASRGAKYASARETNASNNDQLQSDDVHSELRNEVYECLVCTDYVRRRQPMWYCQNCFRILHLSCVKKWRSQCTATKPSDPWPCPTCRTQHSHNPSYLCFCGKTKNPEVNPYNTPHCCEEICGKSRKHGCPHKCPLPCHPGPCPPCSASGPLRACGCGRLQYRLRCGEADTMMSCGEQCGKLLSCGKHYCEQTCHRGDCDPCNEEVERRCYCTKTTRNIRCGEEQEKKVSSFLSHELSGYFACEEICGATLDCFNHSCKSRCHPGDCVGCRLLPERAEYCPCGMTALNRLQFRSEANIVAHGEVHVVPITSRITCTDPLPTCDNKCGKIRTCGHSCTFPCHNGECPPCETKISVTCMCRGTIRKLSCAELERSRRTMEILQIKLPSKTNIRDYLLRNNLDFSEDDGLMVLHARVRMADLMMTCLNECRHQLSTYYKCPYGMKNIYNATLRSSLAGCGRHKCEEICCSVKGLLQTAASAATEELSAELRNLNVSRRARRPQRSRRNNRRQGTPQTADHGETIEMFKHSGAFRRIIYLLFLAGHTGEQKLSTLVTEPCVPLSASSDSCVMKVNDEEAGSLVQSNLDCLSSSFPYPEEFNPSQGPEHMCFRTCDRLLKCNIHRCPDICHKGNCNPCPVLSWEPRFCDCGKTKIDPPVPCEAQLPPCPYPCTKVRDCGHPSNHSCHAGPCPPCTAPTERLCAGGHKVVSGVPCNSCAISCGKPCGRSLSCGLHVCKKVCHSGPCQSNTPEGGDTRHVSCGNQCGKKRRFCSHSCTSICHPDATCPDNPCLELVKVSCGCGRLYSPTRCLHGAKSSTLVAKVSLLKVWKYLVEKFGSSARPHSVYALMTELNVKDQCDNICIDIPCPGDVLETILVSRKLPCNDRCFSASFARSFGEAAGVFPGHGVSWNDGKSGYCCFPDSVICFAQSNPSRACNLDTQLRQFLEQVSVSRQYDPSGKSAKTTLDLGKLKESEKAFVTQLAEVYELTPTSTSTNPSLPLMVKWTPCGPVFGEKRIALNTFVNVCFAEADESKHNSLVKRLTELLVQSANSLFTDQGAVLSLEEADEMPIPIIPKQELKDAMNMRKMDKRTLSVVSQHPMEPSIRDLPEMEIGSWICLEGLPKRYRSDDVIRGLSDASIDVSSQVKSIKRIDDNNILVKFDSPGVAARSLQLLRVAFSSGRLDWSSSVRMRYWGVGVSNALSNDDRNSSIKTSNQRIKRAERADAEFRPPPDPVSQPNGDAWDL